MPGQESVVSLQTDQALRNLLRVNELCGNGVADVVQVRAYLLSPSRARVGTTGLAVGARVELNRVCWRGDGWGSR